MPKFLIWLSACFLGLLAGTSYAAQGELPPAESVALAHFAIQHQFLKLPVHGAFSLDPMAREDDPHFASFEALGVWTNNKYGSAVLGNYSVNRLTGEVWDLFTCERIDFRALAKQQARYRARFGLSPPNGLQPALC
ncbi:MAG TPA: hypothetical protein VGG48_07095 [Rhizomicrobium sp.]|jgi:hypothetical protein